MYRVTTQLNETGINHVCLWRIDSIGMSVESYTRLFVLSRHCTVLRTAWKKPPCTIIFRYCTYSVPRSTL